MKYLALSCAVFLVTACLESVRAEVGYSMRGNTQPFHNWDSAFNNSSRDKLVDGWVLKGAGLRLRPHFGVWAGHIDNVYLSRTEQVEDSYVTIAPGVMLSFGHEDDDYVTLNYVYEDTNYDNERALDDRSHLFSLGLQFTPDRYRIHLSDQYSDRLQQEQETRQWVSAQMNVARLNLQREVSRKSIVGVWPYSEVYRFDEDGYLDYDEYGVGASLSHQTFPKVMTSVDVMCGRVNMIDEAVIGDAHIVEYGVGVQGMLTRKSTLHARTAWQTRDFDDDIEQINTWTASAGLASRFSNRTSWGLDISRHLSPSWQRQGVTRESTKVMPSLRHLLMRDRISTSLSGAYEWIDYYGVWGEVDRQDRYWYVTGLVDWHPAQPFTVGVGYTYAQQESSNGAFDFEVNRLLVRVLVNY